MKSKKTNIETLPNLLNTDFFQKIVDFNEDALFITNIDFTVLFSNKKANEIHKMNLLNSNILSFKNYEKLSEVNFNAISQHALGLIIDDINYTVEILSVVLFNKKLFVFKLFQLYNPQSMQEYKTAFKRFNAVVQNSNDLICLLDEKFNILFINNEFKKKTKYADYEVIGRNINDFIFVEDKKRIRNEFLEFLKSDKLNFISEFRITDKENGILTLSVSLQNYLKDKDINALVSHAKDITREKIIESELSINSAMFKEVFESSADMIFITSLETRKIQMCNKRALEKFGFNSVDKIKNSLVSDFRKYPISSSEIDKINFCLDNNLEYSSQVEMIDKDGTIFFANTNQKKIVLNNANYSLERITDITKFKNIQDNIKLTEQKHQLHMQLTPLGYIEWNLNFEVKEWNKSSEKIFGYTKEEAVGKHASFIIPKEIERHIIDQIWNKLLERKGGERSSNINITKDYKTIHCEWYNTPLLDNDGNLLGVASMIMDVTNQLNDSLKIKNALKEKEVLLSEIHHRVKNNLAVVAGLLFLQSEKIKDAEVKQLFLESESRIKTMAMVHEKVYRSDNFTEIDANEYFFDLTKNILKAYSEKEIEIDLISEELNISINHAIKFGLILNELITNSIKYAFKGNHTPKIIIRFKKIIDKYKLVVADNGIGINVDIINNKVYSTIGIEIIKTVVAQLNGTMEFQNINGAQYEFNFPIN